MTVGQALRETVRHNAIVAHISDDDFLVADTFTTADASPLVERIRGAITVTPQRLTASIGVVCTPLAPLAAEPPDEVVDKLIAIATTAIEQARMAGGNQVRYVLRPSLGEDEDDSGQGEDGWPDADRVRLEPARHIEHLFDMMMGWVGTTVRRAGRKWSASSTAGRRAVSRVAAGCR